MALMISRMELERPPGVSISRMTNGLARCCAVSRPCSTYCAVAGPIAPVIASASAGTGDFAAPAGIAAAATDMAPPHAIRSAAQPARIDVGLLIGGSRYFLRTPRGSRSNGQLLGS